MRQAVLAMALIGAGMTPFAARAQDVTTLCALMKGQSADRGAAYRPGVDVRGRPVVPADSGAPLPLAAEVVKFPLTVDLARRLGSVPQGAKMEAGMGTLEVRDNNVTFNGQDITPRVQAVCGLPSAPVPAASQQAVAEPAPLAPQPPAVPGPQPPSVPAVTPAAVQAAPPPVLPGEPPALEIVQPKTRLTPPGAVLPTDKGTSMPPDISAFIKAAPSAQPARQGKGDIVWGQGN